MMNSRPTRKPEGRGPFLKLRRMIAGVAASKPFLITVSALAAIVCWSALVASDGTLTRQKVFANVAVSVTGDAALKSRGYIVMDDILEEVPAVKMTVEVTQSNYNRVSGTSYNPHFDLTQITGEGENELSVTYSSQLYGPVVSCEPSAITVHVERYITRRVPVVIEMTGAMPEGMYLDSYKTDPTTLSVSGPQSLVASVARVVARLDQSDLSALRMTDRAEHRASGFGGQRHRVGQAGNHQPVRHHQLCRGGNRACADERCSASCGELRRRHARHGL